MTVTPVLSSGNFVIGRSESGKRGRDLRDMLWSLRKQNSSCSMRWSLVQEVCTLVMIVSRIGCGV